MLHEQVRVGSEKKRIWKMCDELLAERGEIPSGREVADLYVASGGNEGTGFTQYSHWKRALAEQQAGAASRASAEMNEPGTVGFRAMNVAGDGTLQLPDDIRAAMLLDRDGRVTVRVEDGELRIISPLAAVKRLQARAEQLIKPGELVSDELIADRRREASRP
ncbi:hypothetical protein DFR52_104327 [Hoeflea marina]|uniref:SpoVT-AbrB domain-containing protein n=1 Tax=Hoeflea marina TaxID=274592 RepID=A0A317PGG1_9HYPH|nr:hypothetical protein [Hoeflea marina]PWV99036.1 hypothetical protein DFR52_104327 [Hoeflea marina]